MEGGLVQAIVADHPESAPDVAVVDYDTEGSAIALSAITQSDGTTSDAVVCLHCVEPADLDLNEGFQ